MRRALLLVFVLTAAAMPVTGATAPQDQTPSFRARAELVSVDVLVRSGGRPVVGLTSTDFDLRDNGVPQQIEAISAGSVPVDLTLLLDVSGSTEGIMDAFKNEIREIAKMLRPEDRVRLVAFSTDVHEVFALRSAFGKLPMDSLTPGGSTSLDDALLFALLHRPDPVRRHLIVAFTDGGENSSIIDNTALVDAVKHVDGILHVVLSDPYADLEKRAKSAGLTITMPMIPGMGSLRMLAEATGGEMHVSDSASKIADSFKKVFDDFRGSYLLRYTPRDVATSGWHDIAVTVTRPGTYDLHARKGYVRD